MDWVYLFVFALISLVIVVYFTFKLIAGASVATYMEMKKNEEIDEDELRKITDSVFKKDPIFQKQLKIFQVVCTILVAILAFLFTQGF